MPYSIIKNKAIKYELYGITSMPTFILLHGFLENSTMWNSLVHHYGSKTHFLTIDIPGHGASQMPESGITMEEMAQVVLQICSENEINRFGIIGHSMGGYVALEVANQAPEKVTCLVLLHSTALADSDEKKENRDRAIAAVAHRKRDYIRNTITNLFDSALLPFLEEQIRRLVLEASQMSVFAIQESLRAMKERKDQKEILRDLTVPKWVILGEKDPILPIREQIDYLQDLPAQIKRVPHGHMSQIEDTSAYLKSFEDILGASGAAEINHTNKLA